MRFETEGEGIMVFIAAIVMAILVLTSGIAWYHYGYFEGKAAAQADQLRELKPKPKPVEP